MVFHWTLQEGREHHEQQARVLFGISPVERGQEYPQRMLKHHLPLRRSVVQAALLPLKAAL